MKLIEINGVHYDIFHCRRGYALQTDSCEIKANSALRSMDDFNQKNWCSHFLSSHWCSVFLFLFLFILLFFGPIYISPIFCVFRRFFVCFVNFQCILSIFGVNPRFQSKQSSCYLSVVQSGCHHNVICIERTIYIKVLDQLMYLHVPQEHAVGPIFCVNQVVSVRLFDIANFKWNRKKNHHRNKIYLPFILYDASVSVNFSIPGRMIAINQTNKCVFVISIFRRVLTIWKTVTSCVANWKVRCSAETFILILVNHQRGADFIFGLPNDASHKSFWILLNFKLSTEQWYCENSDFRLSWFFFLRNTSRVTIDSVKSFNIKAHFAHWINGETNMPE